MTSITSSSSSSYVSSPHLIIQQSTIVFNHSIFTAVIYQCQPTTGFFDPPGRHTADVLMIN